MGALLGARGLVALGERGGEDLLGGGDGEPIDLWPGVTHVFVEGKGHDLKRSDDAVVAAIECDDGFGIARRYELKRESVSCSVVASNGAKDWTCAPVLIDANQFLALSGRERVKYLFDMLDLSKAETTPEALCAAVKNVKLEVNTERSEQVFGEVCEKISASRTKAASVQEWLDALVADLRDMKAETDREAKRLTATVQGLTQMRADQNPVNINRPIDAELATARALLEKINGEGAARVAANTGGAVAVAGDVSQRDDIDRAVATALEKFGRLDIVVNNAGIMKLASLADSDDSLFDSQVAINLKGTFNTLRLAARRLRDGGRIVNLSTSVVGLKLENYGVYAATKAAVETMTAILSKELRGRSITVNAVAPGPTATDLFLNGKSDELIARMAKMNPLERLGTPADIAHAVAFLVGPDGGWINGQVIRANGGMV